MRNLPFKSAWLCITVFFAIAISPHKGNAQTQDQFINLSTWGWANLDAGQQSKVTLLQSQLTYASLQYVDVGNLPSLQEDGWLDIQVPGKTCTTRLKAKHVESFPNGDYYWFGTVVKEDGETAEECSCYDGSVNLISKGGKIAGSLKIDEDIYELHDLGQNKRVLVKKDYENHTFGCGNDNSEEFQQGEEPVVEDRNGGNCPVRVLALFTQNAEDALPDIQNIINLTINQTNQAFRSSGVAQSDLDLVLVGIREVDFDESNNARDDRDALIDNNDVQDLRDDANADIVVVFAESDYGDVLGIAGTLTLQEERALCLIRATEAVNEYNTSHEIAHLFACRHEEDADPTGEFEHAFCFKTGCWPFRKHRNTIMWSTVTGNTIQHFSNPNVKFKEKATGEADAHNARQLRGNACTVANFRDDDVIPNLHAAISGSGYGCPCQSTGVFASVTGGAPGNYTLAWRTSTDGFNWSPVQGTGTSLSIELPCVEGEGIYVQLTATSVDGQVENAFRFIEAATTWYGQEGPCMRSNDYVDAGNLGSIIAYPNPMDERIIVQGSTGAEESKVNIRLYDSFGRLLQEVKKGTTGRNFTVSIETPTLSPGIYALRVEYSGEQQIFKIIKK